MNETVNIEIPAALLRAVKLLIEKYEVARRIRHVRQPVSYAMYNTWREIERREEERKVWAESISRE